MRTQPQARATKQQARINRFKELKGEVHQTVNNDDLEINFETSRIGKKVVNLEHVDFAYEDGKQILSDFNLIMQNRDRIGMLGIMVSGNRPCSIDLMATLCPQLVS